MKFLPLLLSLPLLVAACHGTPGSDAQVRTAARADANDLAEAPARTIVPLGAHRVRRRTRCGSDLRL